jgi:hypothetical protein
MNLWRRRIYSPGLKEGTGGGRWAGVPRLPSQHLPTLGTAGGGGDAQQNPDSTAFVCWSLSKAMSNANYHTIWSGLAVPKRVTRRGWGKSLVQFFPYQRVVYVSKM